MSCQREACSCCGASSWTEAFFIAGRLYCRACHIEILRSKGKSPPKQQALKGIEPVQPGGVAPTKSLADIPWRAPGESGAAPPAGCRPSFPRTEN